MHQKFYIVLWGCSQGSIPEIVLLFYSGLVLLFVRCGVVP